MSALVGLQIYNTESDADSDVDVMNGKMTSSHITSTKTNKTEHMNEIFIITHKN